MVGFGQFLNMAFSLNFICFCILFATRRSFQPAWQSQNCLCFETALMKHITKATKPHARMRFRGGVDHSLALIFFGIQNFRKMKKNKPFWQATDPVCLVICFIKAVTNKNNSVTARLAESCAALSKVYKNNHIEGMMMLMTTTTMINVKACDYAATVRFSVRWPCGHCIPTRTN